jgi:hypothetical protein
MSRRKKKWKKRGNPLVRFLRPVEAELVASSMTPSSLDSYPPPPPPHLNPSHPIHYPHPLPFLSLHLYLNLVYCYYLFSLFLVFFFFFTRIISLFDCFYSSLQP